jgi:hypothetical protein
VGCKLYDLLSKNKVELCPGNVCSYNPAPGAGGSWLQGLVLLMFFVVVFNVTSWVYGHPTLPAPTKAAAVSTPLPHQDAAEVERCTVPEFAKKIGHEQQWKLHNGCQ